MFTNIVLSIVSCLPYWWDKVLAYLIRYLIRLPKTASIFDITLLNAVSLGDCPCPSFDCSVMDSNLTILVIHSIDDKLPVSLNQNGKYLE